jgi:hypothetical protein
MYRRVLVALLATASILGVSVDAARPAPAQPIDRTLTISHGINRRVHFRPRSDELIIAHQIRWVD